MNYLYQKPKLPVTADSAERWRAYVETLAWQPGQLDDASYHAFLRAGSLGIDRETALSVVAERIQSTDAHLRPSKVESQLERAYRHVIASDMGNPISGTIERLPRKTWPAPEAGLIERGRNQQKRGWE